MPKPIYLEIELADTPDKHQKGLMFRESLDENSGMLFKFSIPQVLKFWGLNTYIPLDIAFISPENKIVKIDRIKPFDVKRSVSSDCDCLMALEACDGFFNSKGIKPGEKITLKNRDGKDIIIFGENTEDEIELKDIMS